MRMVFLLGLAACHGVSPNASEPNAPPPWEVIALDTNVEGLSGLTADENGTLWAVAEETRALLEIDVTNGAVKSWPVLGLDDALELESIASLGHGRFVVGTERSGADRNDDWLVYLQRAGDEFNAVDQVMCPYAQWGLHAGHNRGIEGLCVTDDQLIVASEVVSVRAGQRFAPLARRDRFGAWVASSLELTSSEGKVSGLSCRRGPEGSVDALAIERHFGELHLLQFRIPPEGGVIHPSAVHRFDDWVSGQALPPNLEGIAVLPDGRIALIDDNYFRGERTGPSSLYLLPPDLFRTPSDPP